MRRKSASCSRRRHRRRGSIGARRLGLALSRATPGRSTGTVPDTVRRAPRHRLDCPVSARSRGSKGIAASVPIGVATLSTKSLAVRIASRGSSATALLGTLLAERSPLGPPCATPYLERTGGRTATWHD